MHPDTFCKHVQDHINIKLCGRTAYYHNAFYDQWEAMGIVTYRLDSLDEKLPEMISIIDDIRFNLPANL
jgi:hypothetical protein